MEEISLTVLRIGDYDYVAAKDIMGEVDPL
jgi:hypothetical protein